MKIDLSDLNANQLKAIEQVDGAIAVMASAGSGKTRTLTKKVAHMVMDLGIKPNRIWVCTFTKVAANEMQTRLKKMIGAEKSDRLKLSTLHSLAYQIWKSGMKRKMGDWWKPPKILANEGQAQWAMFQMMKKEKFALLDSKMALASIASYKLNLLDPKAYLEMAREESLENGAPLDETPSNPRYCLYLCYKWYEAWKKENKYIDFQDMLYNCYTFLENKSNSEFREKLSQKIEYIMVDEVQDTNTICFKILDILCEYHKNVMIVGDTRQSIYSFQGAKLNNIHDFFKKYNPTLIDLDTNYRSTKNIVDVANRFISTAHGVIGGPAKTPNPTGSDIKFFTNYDTGAEADEITYLIESLVEQGAKYKDICILYRVHSQTRLLEDSLIISRIPYIIFSEEDFFTRKEIVDLLTYFKFFINPGSMTATKIKKIINRPTRYVSNKDIDDIEEFSIYEEVNMWEAMQSVWSTNLPHKSKENISRFVAEIRTGHRMYSSNASNSELVDYILEGMNYTKWLVKDNIERQSDQDVELNLVALKESISRFDSINEYLEYIEIMKEEHKKRKEMIKNHEKYDAVKIMSVHASKGKEFNTVIILGACDRIFPFYKSVQEGNLEEEKRVFYVALTRPEKNLYISAIQGTLGNINVVPSRFLYQLGINYKGDSNEIRQKFKFSDEGSNFHEEIAKLFNEQKNKIRKGKDYDEEEFDKGGYF